jgi:hypothetical protein
MIPTFQIWELTSNAKVDNGGTPIEWVIEWPAFTWGKEFELKKLVAGELWIDQLYGKVSFKMEYRPDGDPRWRKWKEWTLTQKDFDPMISAIQAVRNYPPVALPPDYRSSITLPEPPQDCASSAGRPCNVAFQIQPKLTVTGQARIRGILLHAEVVQKGTYDGLVP